MHTLNFTDSPLLLQNAPAFSLWNNKNFSYFVESLYQKKQDYHHILIQYPQLKCEYLDIYYIILQNLGAFNYQLLEDFLSFPTKGVWGVFLTMLDPKPEYLSLLNSQKDNFIHSKWMFELAISIINGQKSNNFNREINMLKDIREVLNTLPLPIIPLRTYPTDKDISDFSSYQQNLKHIYKNFGLIKAQEYLKNNPLPMHYLQYDKWREHLKINAEK